jgi:hypothetical protein
MKFFDREMQFDEQEISETGAAIRTRARRLYEKNSFAVSGLIRDNANIEDYERQLNEMDQETERISHSTYTISIKKLRHIRDMLDQFQLKERNFKIYKQLKQYSDGMNEVIAKKDYPTLWKANSPQH